ncbi:MAG: ABC transporter ATP-binding protein [Betaproteobacteria bacterium]|nr:ABC transporter ATP-binding protein [Betaproteobacteria bacterium]
MSAAVATGIAAAQPARLVDVDGVTKCFGTEDDRQICLESCSFGIPRGKLTVLMGPSGCGKTTLINLIAGYELPDRGSVRLEGAPVAGPGSDRLVVFQETTLFPWMTVYGNVAFGCKVKRLSQAAIREKAERILAKVGLYAFRDKYPSQLSGGMQRRTELARALINDPKLMILDEPFRGLDAMTRELMQEFYLKLFEETCLTTLFVTHELEEAIFMADRLVLLTYKPGQVKEILDVDLPRPRHFSMFASKRFFELHDHAMSLLVEESKKAFAAGCTSAFDQIAGARPPAGG